jgi:predicted ATPase/class 3 adenylate cyclase
LAELPTGTVTFLFTDLEGSTRLWDEQPEAMKSALARHDGILVEAVEAKGGHVVKSTGDGLHAVFATADTGIAAAAAAQQALVAEPWGPTGPLRVRMGLHTGVAELRGDDYFGSSLNRAARLSAVAHGGQVVCSQATADLARDGLRSGMALLDLGEHRLRDLSRPERVFQVQAPGLRSEFGPLASLDAFPGNLPLQVSSFIGRERDVARVAAALDDARVVTLTGVGGVGKTRLALQVAAEVLPRFRDGAWLCELQMVRDIAGVEDAVAGVFRVTARPSSTLQESLVAYLSDQQLVMVLDNCEHLLDGAATLVEVLERFCPEVSVLATSREPLAIDGERVLGVRSLASAAADASLDDIARADAVRLFVERARAVKDGFSLTGANAPDVVQICDRLDGVPLAIELAAARVTAMNPRELARRLDRRFQLLAGGRRRAIERHQTLRATIDWSYDLLSEAQRRLLARLAVFAGGCTLEAAETVCAGDPIARDEILELLAGLVDRSLVVADDEGSDTRYRLLETIRQYAEERLADNGETETLRAGHAGYYAGFAAEVAAHIYGPEQLEWGARLARERDNLHAAMAYALDTENLDLAFGLFCHVPAGPEQINDVVVFDPAPLLALAHATEHPGSALALLAAGFRAWHREGDPQRALSLCDQALAAEQRLGRGPGEPVEALAPILRGEIAQAAGDTQRAVQILLDGADRARAVGRPARAATLLGDAALTLAWSDPEAARRPATEGLALARQTGMPYAIAYNLQGLVHALAETDPDQARAALAEALESHTTLGYESPGGVTTSVFATARLQEWPAMLRAASRALHHQTRTGVLGLVYVAAILNLVARGLAESQPEAAAVVQGSVTAVLSRIAPDMAVHVQGSAPDQNEVAAFVTAVRRDTTQILTAELGAARLRELRAQGAAMDETQACTYARAHVDQCLTQTAVAS